MMGKSQHLDTQVPRGALHVRRDHDFQVSCHSSLASAAYNPEGLPLISKTAPALLKNAPISFSSQLPEFHCQKNIGLKSEAFNIATPVRCEAFRQLVFAN